jgi:hypothetical protein
MDYFKENVTTIKVPFLLEDMSEDLEAMENTCDIALAQYSPQCLSAKFVDLNDNPILVYFGLRKDIKGKFRPEVGLKL